MKNLFDMKGKTVLITGGSRGLGRAMALGFADYGADVAIVSRKLDACKETARACEQLGVRAFAYACHVAHWDELEPMVDAVYAHFGKVDVLINNAGMSPLYSSLVEITEDYFDKVIGINFKGPFRLCALVGDRMMKGRGGSIINVSSVGSLRSGAHIVPYGAAKAALNSMTAGFAHAYGPKVRVNCILPGAFETDVSKHWPDDPKLPRPELALRRVGQPEEIVTTALYLASDHTSYTTGAQIVVAGSPMQV